MPSAETHYRLVAPDADGTLAAGGGASLWPRAGWWRKGCGPDVDVGGQHRPRRFPASCGASDFAVALSLRVRGKGSRVCRERGGCRMHRMWILAAALGWLVLAAQARADIVHLKDGRSLWGTDVIEEGDAVVLVRPGGNLKFPKAQVTRIERVRSSLAPYYSPPTTPPPGTAGAPGGPGTPGGPAPGAPGSPGAAGTPAPAGPPAVPGAGSPSVSPPPSPGAGPTQLPPPPPPGGGGTRY